MEYTIVEGFPVPEGEYVVAEAGTYAATDLVPCKRVGESYSTCAFLAQFIATGVNP